MVSRISFLVGRAFGSTLFVLVLSAFLIASDSARADDNPRGETPGGAQCTCPALPSLEKAYDAGTLVFVGQVLDKRINPLKKGDYEIKFQVTRKLKGFEDILPSKDLPDSSVLVYTPKENAPGKIGDCAFDFVINGEYLVYALGAPAYLKTSACTRSALLDKSLMDVQRIIRLYSAE